MVSETKIKESIWDAGPGIERITSLGCLHDARKISRQGDRGKRQRTDMRYTQINILKASSRRSFNGWEDRVFHPGG